MNRKAQVKINEKNTHPLYSLPNWAADLSETELMEKMVMVFTFKEWKRIQPGKSITLWDLTNRQLLQLEFLKKYNDELIKEGLNREQRKMELLIVFGYKLESHVAR